ncbi:MAG: protein-tyrosine-phosphatase [Bacteroidia bacterium]
MNKILTLVALLLINFSLSAQTPPPMPLFPVLQNTIEQLQTEYPLIPDGRREELDAMASYIKAQAQNERTVSIVFICTHNSRRSHMAQLWAAAAAAYYGKPAGLNSYSGGTEVTAFNSRAVRAMREAGFSIPEVEGENPVYLVHLGETLPPLRCFSKPYFHESNPKKDFAAVMTCSDADEACPIVFGADERFSLPYDDPKHADGTAAESERYRERCRQIGREICYVFSQL